MTADLPIGGSTGLDHTSTSSIDEAVAWLVVTPREQRGPAVPALQSRFGLTPAEACQAIAAANLARARAT